MSATHTEERILKLHAKGLTLKSIARKIGRPGVEGEERASKAIVRAGMDPNKEKNDD